jgi:hypothetical protein
MVVEDLLSGPPSSLVLAGPAKDPLREDDALQEAQLLDVRIAVATSAVGLLFEMRTALQLSSAARSSRRTVVLEDWALVAVGGRAGSGGHWLGSSWSTPIASVVPLSL